MKEGLNDGGGKDETIEAGSGGGGGAREKMQNDAKMAKSK